LADAYNILGFYGHLAPKEAFPKAKAAARTALEMDNGLAEAHVSLGYAIHFYDWNWKEAEAEYQQALEQIPNYALTHHWYFNFLVSMGRFDKATAEGKKAIELDPLSLVSCGGLGWIYYHKRDYDKAIAQCMKTTEMDRTFAMGWLWGARAYLAKGMRAEALAAFREATVHDGHSPITEAFLAHGQAVVGNARSARKTLEELLEIRQTRYVSAFLIALIWLPLGDIDRTFEWLRKAYDERSHWLVFLDVDPCLDELRGDPRFDELRNQVGLSKGIP
jgi:tetratricopeptide (TPR) repeat protein